MDAIAKLREREDISPVALRQIIKVFGDELESILFKRLRNLKRNPVLLIFALKAHWREKLQTRGLRHDQPARIHHSHHDRDHSIWDRARALA